jgi:hypothetical protein
VRMLPEHHLTYAFSAQDKLYYAVLTEKLPWMWS